MPHPISLNAGLVESEFHPQSHGSASQALSYYRRKKSNLCGASQSITFPVFIPTIPEYLDSCLSTTGGRSHVDDDSCLVPECDLDYLSRYLALDSPHQQDKLLSKVRQVKLLEGYFVSRRQRQDTRMKKILERRRKHSSNCNSGPQLPFPMPDL